MDVTRSWHGTSVQCTQPLPHSGHLTVDDVLALPTDSSRHNKHMHTPPVGTPVAREKHKRRRRTLTEHASPHTSLVTENGDITTAHSNLFQETSRESYLHSTNAVILTIDDFRPSYCEQSALDKCKQDLYFLEEWRHLFNFQASTV